MSFVIYLASPAIGGASDLDGKYVKDYDPNARDGRGTVKGTADSADALKFETAGDALAFWHQTSTVRPLRPDGKPNKPLTAYHVEILDESLEPLPFFGEGGTG